MSLSFFEILKRFPRRTHEGFERTSRVVRASRVRAEHLLTSIVRTLHGTKVTPLFVFEKFVLRLERLVAVRQFPPIELRTRVHSLDNNQINGRKEGMKNEVVLLVLVLVFCACACALVYG